MAFGHWPTGRKAEVFDGRLPQHPAAADLFHSLLSIAVAASRAARFRRRHIEKPPRR
jgi:hypothetical protein